MNGHWFGFCIFQTAQLGLVSGLTHKNQIKPNRTTNTPKNYCCNQCFTVRYLLSKLSWWKVSIMNIILLFFLSSMVET